MFPKEHHLHRQQCQQQQQQQSQSYHFYSNIQRSSSRPLRSVQISLSRSNSSTGLYSEPKSNNTVTNQSKQATTAVLIDVKSDNDDNDDNDDDDDDVNEEEKRPANSSDEGANDLKMSALKKLYRGSLKRLLEDKHGITIDNKKQNWMSPWKLAVMIHCLDTNQDYSAITKRPAPTPKEIEMYVLRRGIQNTKENRLRARLEMKRNQMRRARQFLVQVLEERGHVMKSPPTDKSDWQILYIQIQESVLQVVHNQEGADEVSPTDSTRA